MAAKGEMDAVTGVETTGHEWDGIRELNNPLPRWWVYTFYVCIAFSVVWWILVSLLALDLRPLAGPARLEPAPRLRAPLRGGPGGAGTVDRPDRGPGHGRDPADPELVQFAIAGGEKQLQDQLRPLPWPGRRRPGLLPDAGRRRLALGR